MLLCLHLASLLCLRSVIEKKRKKEKTVKKNSGQSLLPHHLCYLHWSVCKRKEVNDSKCRTFSQLRFSDCKCFMPDERWKCVFPQIKTEDLHGSPHSGAPLRTCHMTQGSPMGQLTGVNWQSHFGKTPANHEKPYVQATSQETAAAFSWPRETKRKVCLSQSESLDF